MVTRFAEWRGARNSRAIRTRFTTAMLERVPLFADLTPRERGKIALLVREENADEGTTLVTAGESGGEMFMIVDGEVVVKTKRGHPVELKAGDFFGEMSLIDGAPRSATVEAKTPVRLLVLGQRDFWHVLDETKTIVRKVMHTLCQRLREAETPASR